MANTASSAASAISETRSSVMFAADWADRGESGAARVSAKGATTLAHAAMTLKNFPLNKKIKPDPNKRNYPDRQGLADEERRSRMLRQEAQNHFAGFHLATWQIASANQTPNMECYIRSLARGRVRNATQGNS